MLKRTCLFNRAVLMDGVQLAASMREKLAKDVATCHAEHIAHLDEFKRGKIHCGLCEDISSQPHASHHHSRARPGFGVVVVGEDSRPTSVYIKNKLKAAAETGFQHKELRLNCKISQEELEARIVELDEDPEVHGIILQRPLADAPHLDVIAATNKISPVKDIDGLHHINTGLLHSRNAPPFHAPCTAMSVLRLLQTYDVPIVARRAVVLGTSNVAGRPISELLLQNGAAVTTLAQRQLSDECIKNIIREADIIVSASGVRQLVRKSWIKPGAAIIDVGLTPIADPKGKNGYRLVGDVVFDEAVEVAGFLTPVPGGVGPVTVAALLENTLRAYRLCTRHAQRAQDDALHVSRELWRLDEEARGVHLMSETQKKHYQQYCFY